MKHAKLLSAICQVICKPNKFRSASKVVEQTNARVIWQKFKSGPSTIPIKSIRMNLEHTMN